VRARDALKHGKEGVCARQAEGRRLRSARLDLLLDGVIFRRSAVHPKRKGLPHSPLTLKAKETEGMAAPVQALDGARDEFLAPLDARLI
jgi:hypothetical protein